MTKRNSGVTRILMGGMALAAISVAGLAFAETPEAPASAPLVAAAEVSEIDKAVAGLQTFYATVTDFKASFKQVVRRKHLPRPLTKRGTVFFKRPGKMRWDYSQPERVYYISDGDILWSYQPEDKLVYKVPVKGSELYGALQFLFGQGDLKKAFNISAGEAKEGQVALKLVPKTKQSNYKRLILHLDATTYQIIETELVDPLDNVSLITFSDPSYEPLKDEGFKFTPPKGVRVEDLKGSR